jgi:hypothetical protein
MARLLRLHGRLRLTVNAAKSAVAGVSQRKFLGYSFWVAPGSTIKRRVADKPMAALKQRVQGQARRSGGRRRQEKSGPMDAAPDASHPAQTMETRNGYLLETYGLERFHRGCRRDSGQYPALVAQQRDAAQLHTRPEMGRQVENAPPLWTSTSRTARCGTACGCWGRGGEATLPPMPIREVSGRGRYFCGFGCSFAGRCRR